MADLPPVPTSPIEWFFEAIRIAGSQRKLGKAGDIRQQGLSAIATGKTKKISAEMAIKIDRATGGAVPKHCLAPDIFDQPQRGNHGTREEERDGGRDRTREQGPSQL